MKYVKTYLRTYVTVDGTVVADEPEKFTEAHSRSHHSMYFDPDRGYRLADAEKLVAHWTLMGIPHGQTYRLQDERDLVKIAERDYEDVAPILDALHNSIERNEGFTMDTEFMKFLTGKLDTIRQTLGLEAFKPYPSGECSRCGSTPGKRDQTCPVCTNLDGTDKL